MSTGKKGVNGQMIIINQKAHSMIPNKFSWLGTFFWPSSPHKHFHLLTLPLFVVDQTLCLQFSIESVFSCCLFVLFSFTYHMSNSNKTRERHITASDYNFLRISLPWVKIQHIKRTLDLVPLPTQKLSYLNLAFANVPPLIFFMVFTIQL